MRLYLIARGGTTRPSAGAGGVHVGTVVFRDGDYFGRTVNLAARITDYARPGEVLVSQSVVESVDGSDGVRFEPIGPVTLKGVSEPVVLHVARGFDSIALGSLPCQGRVQQPNPSHD